MYYAVATFEEGKAVHEVRTAFFGSIEEVCHEVACLCKNGRIATCDIMIRVRGKIHRIKSVVL